MPMTYSIDDMFAVPVIFTLLPGVTEKYSTVPAGRSIPVGAILLDLLFVSCTNEIRHPSDVATLIRFDNAMYSLSVTSSDADILAATIPFNASSFEAFLVEKYPPICCLSLFSISFQVRLFHTFGKLVQLYIIRVKFV